MCLTVALTSANDTPRIAVDNGKVLRPALCEGVLKIVAVAKWLFPSVVGVSQEHAQQMARARLAVGTSIRPTSVQDAQIVDKLNVALLAIELHAKALCQLFNRMHGMHLLFRDTRHGGVPVDHGRSQERGLDQLAYRPAL